MTVNLGSGGHGGNTICGDKLLREGPLLQDLIGQTRDSRNGRKRVAVAIPTRGWNEILSEHVKRLSRQSFRDFDIIIIYGEDDEFLDDDCGLSIIHMKRKEDCGSAGGFYIGEKFAFDEGYEMVILADNDALPDSESLIGELVRAIDGGADVALPKVRNKPDAPAKTIDIIAQYGCLSRRALAKAGFAFFPFYFGGEDIEHLARMRNLGAKVAYVDSFVLHPPFSVSMFVIRPSKMLHHLRGTILFMYLTKPPPDVYYWNFLPLVYGLSLLPYRPGIFYGMSRAVVNGSSMRFFRIPVPPEYEAAPMPVKGAEGFEAVPLADNLWKGPTLAEKVSGAFRASARYLAQYPKVFGKNVVFNGAVNQDGLPLAIIAKNSFLIYDGKIYPVFSSNRYWLFPLFLVYFPAAVIFSAIAALVLGTAGYAKLLLLGVKTKGYGLPRGSA